MLEQILIAKVFNFGGICSVPLLGTPSRVSEVLRGKKGLSITMVQRLRARFRVSADVLLPPPDKKPTRATKRAAA